MEFTIPEFYDEMGKLSTNAKFIIDKDYSGGYAITYHSATCSGTISIRGFLANPYLLASNPSALTLIQSYYPELLI